MRCCAAASGLFVRLAALADATAVLEAAVRLVVDEALTPLPRPREVARLRRSARAFSLHPDPAAHSVFFSAADKLAEALEGPNQAARPVVIDRIEPPAPIALVQA